MMLIDISLEKIIFYLNDFLTLGFLKMNKSTQLFVIFRLVRIRFLILLITNIMAKCFYCIFCANVTN